MRKCSVCEGPIVDKKLKHCSKKCSGIARIQSNMKSQRKCAELKCHRTEGLPDSGNAFLLYGQFFKIGSHGFSYRFGDDSWVRSSVAPSVVKRGIKGVFQSGLFFPEGAKNELV